MYSCTLVCGRRSVYAGFCGVPARLLGPSRRGGARVPVKNTIMSILSFLQGSPGLSSSGACERGGGRAAGTRHRRPFQTDDLVPGEPNSPGKSHAELTDVGANFSQFSRFLQYNLTHSIAFCMHSQFHHSPAIYLARRPAEGTSVTALINMSIGLALGSGIPIRIGADFLLLHTPAFGDHPGRCVGIHPR